MHFGVSMKEIRKAGDRGATRLPWLKSRHSFSFGSYRNPQENGFSDLRVINRKVSRILWPSQGDDRPMSMLSLASSG